MPKIENVKITDTMIEAVNLYDEGHSIDEIAQKLKRKKSYIQWCMTIMNVAVDEMKYTAGTKSAMKFIKAWNEVTFSYKWDSTREMVMKGLRADYRRKWRMKK